MAARGDFPSIPLLSPLAATRAATSAWLLRAWGPPRRPRMILSAAVRVHDAGSSFRKPWMRLYVVQYVRVARASLTLTALPPALSQPAAKWGAIPASPWRGSDRATGSMVPNRGPASSELARGSRSRSRIQSQSVSLDQAHESPPAPWPMASRGRCRRLGPLPVALPGTVTGLQWDSEISVPCGQRAPRTPDFRPTQECSDLDCSFDRKLEPRLDCRVDARPEDRNDQRKVHPLLLQAASLIPPPQYRHYCN